jgi:hypothetical protein
MFNWFGATRLGVWTIKHLVTPLDRWLYRRTGGNFLSTGKPAGPILLLTTTGRRSGLPRTTPVFYLRDGDRLIICNTNPGFERTNHWVLNYWPLLTCVWPAYQGHYDRSGRRTVFILQEVKLTPP